MAHSICLSMNSIVTSVSLPNCDYLKQMCQRSIELLWKVCSCTTLCLSSKDISFRVGKVLRWFLNLHWASNLGMVLVSFFFSYPISSLSAWLCLQNIYIRIPIISHLYSYHSSPKDCCLFHGLCEVISYLFSLFPSPTVCSLHNSGPFQRCQIVSPSDFLMLLHLTALCIASHLPDFPLQQGRLSLFIVAQDSKKEYAEAAWVHKSQNVTFSTFS